MRTFVTPVRVRSYELDSFGHLNHAVVLNYLEEARWRAFEEGGFPIADLRPGGEAVYVVRVEVEYRGEARLGDELLVRTRTEKVGRSSITLRQDLLRGAGGAAAAEGGATADGADGAKGGTAAEGAVAAAAADGIPTDEEMSVAEARIVLVWIGPGGRPTRVPGPVRDALTRDPSA